MTNDGPEHPDAGQRELFAAAVQVLPGGQACVVVAGELDVAAVDIVRKVLVEARTAGQGDVRLDLARLQFCDAAGIGEFVRAQTELARAGRRLVVERAPAPIRRTLRLAQAEWLLE